MFLFILSWVSTLFQIVFLTLALASALYYLAELVEEYTVLAAKIIKYILIAVTVVYICLLVFEGFPWLMIAIGLVSNGIYSMLLKDFPFIDLTSPVFIASIASVFINHYLAFQHFSQVWYPFSEVLAYFTICLWILPFSFFVSLSASENVLPTATASGQESEDSSYDYPGQRSHRQLSILAFFNFLFRKTEEYLPTRTKTSKSY
ncbi:protein TEX261-like [Actinia tenebrosa]|uniref:Protein TEX261 n=1 Tax=Actinia tenebrosa TaxID=6105 RepID=A0A6P8J058_ACTTE|nr:protein TEX261-like [Actinia tenebrosa]XP_031571350.1 protein TEX261-like [Actinia tenebrosa]